MVQGPGVPVEFVVIQGISAKQTLPMASAANPGTLLKYNPGGTPPGVDTAGGSDVVLAGVLQEATFDPSTVPALVANQVWGIGVLEIRKIGEPVSVWDNLLAKFTNVSGTINEGDFIRATTGGLLIGTTTTNNITNGSLVCTVGNASVSGAPVVARLLVS